MHKKDPELTVPMDGMSMDNDSQAWPEDSRWKTIGENLVDTNPSPKTPVQQDIKNCNMINHQIETSSEILLYTGPINCTPILFGMSVSAQISVDSVILQNNLHWLYSTNILTKLTIESLLYVTIQNSILCIPQEKLKD
jgi:hypothetical protein